MWTIVLALVGPWVTFGIAWQLYTAAARGYILTGHSMNRKVYREQNARLFRDNVIANIIMLPVAGAGSALFVARALGLVFR